MTLSVIGAGFGRTGTESMKMALEMLGLGPCHHMKEVLSNPEQIACWRAAAIGNIPNWDAVFAEYKSAIDWPAAYFWRELADVYPRAKILLTLRDAESWYDSMANTILKVITISTEPDSVGVKLIGEKIFGGRLAERDHAIAIYEKNTADVQAAFPPERLLVHSLGDGWGPLCEFLGLPVPDAPFPRSNSTADFNTAMSDILQGKSP